MDPGKDFSVAAVDAFETWKTRRQTPSAPSSSSNSHGSSSSSAGAGAHDGGPSVVEGKGMLSWAMAENKGGMTTVIGKITGTSEAEARRSKRRKGEDGNAVRANSQEEEESDSGDEAEETLEVWLQLAEVSFHFLRRDSFRSHRD